MRTPWPILLLLVAAGCQSIPSDAVGLRSTSAAPHRMIAAGAPAAYAASQPAPSSIAPRVIVAPPVGESQPTDRKTTPLMVELPPGWDQQAQPTVVVVPVPADVAPPLPGAGPQPKVESNTPQSAAKTSEEELLERLKTIETAVQALVTRVEEMEELPAEPAPAPEPPEPPSQIVDARELPYQVGFLK